jgi:RNA polymerase sigma-70 factor, ECF subfamily
MDEEWDWGAIRARCRVEARRLLRDREEAEEVVQEALARAWRSRSSCRTPEAPIGWCLQITRNEAFRLIGRRRPVEHFDPDAQAVDTHSLSEGDRTLERVDLQRALSRLQEAERLLIALRYEHDWSHLEIAARLQIPEATARVRLHRAQKRLQNLFAEAE